MAAKKSKRLVIDASVARSAGGEDAIASQAKGCRDFLTVVLTICHSVTVTSEIQEEWNRHRSNFARRWLVSMYSKRKVHRCNAVMNQTFRKRIEKTVSNV